MTESQPSFNQPPGWGDRVPDYVRGGIEPGSPQDAAFRAAEPQMAATDERYRTDRKPGLKQRLGAAGVLVAILVAGGTVFGMNHLRSSDVAGRQDTPTQAPRTTEHQAPTTSSAAPTSEQSQPGASETSDDKTGLPELPDKIENYSYDELNDYVIKASGIMLNKFGKAKPAEVLNSGDPGAVSIIEITSVDGEMFVSGDESAPSEASVQIGYENSDGNQVLFTFEETRRAEGEKKRTPQDFLSALKNGEYRLGGAIGFTNEAEGTAGEVYIGKTRKIVSDDGASAAINAAMAAVNKRP